MIDFSNMQNLKPMQDIFEECAKMVLGEHVNIQVTRGRDILSEKVFLRLKVKDVFGSWQSIDRDVTGKEDDENYMCRVFGQMLGEARNISTSLSI
jgi:hypothetical protein